jgi:hypothetical protein
MEVLNRERMTGWDARGGRWQEITPEQTSAEAMPRTNIRPARSENRDDDLPPCGARLKIFPYHPTGTMNDAAPAVSGRGRVRDLASLAVIAKTSAIVTATPAGQNEATGAVRGVDSDHWLTEGTVDRQ